MKRVRVVATGTVQGVGFRVTTKAEAERIGVAGWVRNLGSDRVEAEIQGEDPRVAEVLSWLRHGPPDAEVSRIDVTDADVVDGEHGFRIRRSG